MVLIKPKDEPLISSQLSISNEEVVLPLQDGEEDEETFYEGNASKIPLLTLPLENLRVGFLLRKVCVTTVFCSTAC